MSSILLARDVFGQVLGVCFQGMWSRWIAQVPCLKLVEVSVPQSPCSVEDPLLNTRGILSDDRQCLCFTTS